MYLSARVLLTLFIPLVISGRVQLTQSSQGTCYCNRTECQWATGIQTIGPNGEENLGSWNWGHCAWPTKSIPSAIESEVMQSIALRNNIWNNFQKVIKRRNIDWKTFTWSQTIGAPCEVSSRYHTRFSYQHSAILFKHDFRKCSPSYFH